MKATNIHGTSVWPDLNRVCGLYTSTQHVSVSLQLVPSVDNVSDWTTARRWVEHLESKRKEGGLSKIDGFPEAIIPKELKSITPPSEEGHAQRPMHLAACARTAITLLLSASLNNAIAVMTVCSGDKKQIALERMVSHGTWDVDTGDSVPTTVVVLVEGECIVKDAAKELPLKSLRSKREQGSMLLTAVSSLAKNGNETVAQCFVSGIWWEFDGKRARTIDRPETVDGYCFFYQRLPPS